MRVLALEAYYGGSHQAFIDGWSARSRHQWELLTLPANKWKWRMRQASFVFSQQVRELMAGGASWDLLFTSDMTPLAELRGLLPRELAEKPSILYFHENQLTYPVRFESSRDFHFGLSNLTSALAATEVWFNSEFHRRELLGAIDGLLAQLPKPRPVGWPQQIKEKSRVESPPIELVTRRAPEATRTADPLRIAWVGRWEFDKAPEVFFAGLEELEKRGVEFEVSVLGQSFERVPAVFESARRLLEKRVVHWGFLPERADFELVLSEADVVVSTARHEFFGLAILEATSASAMPLVPRRLSYPELFAEEAATLGLDPFFDGGSSQLADRLAELATRKSQGESLKGRFVASARRHSWEARTEALDDALERVATGSIDSCSKARRAEAL